MQDLTPDAFNLILSKLSDDPVKAGDEYTTLRSKLEFFFRKKNVNYQKQADVTVLTDKTIDRLAKKLEDGVEIKKNILAYALGIARYIWLEYVELPTVDIDKIPEPPALEPAPEEEEEDGRLACLRSCLASVPKDDEERKLILSYYSKNGGKIKERRKALADKLGITTNALKVRMTRLREKLKNCIGKCMGENL